MDKINVRNRIRCAVCHEIIESYSRHNFKFCKCRSVFVDGGKDYHRWGGRVEDIIVIYDDDSELPLESHIKLEKLMIKTNKK